MNISSVASMPCIIDLFAMDSFQGRGSTPAGKSGSIVMNWAKNGVLGYVLPPKKQVGCNIALTVNTN